LYVRIKSEETPLQKVIQTKISFVVVYEEHVMTESNIKALVFGIMDGNFKRGRQLRKWMDDIWDGV
jgi:hypothetical protein